MLPSDNLPSTLWPEALESFQKNVGRWGQRHPPFPLSPLELKTAAFVSTSSFSPVQAGKGN